MRATFGKRSGPTTTSATTPITASLVMPISIMQCDHEMPSFKNRSKRGFVFLFGLYVDRRLLLLLCLGSPLFFAFDAILETLDCLAQIRAHITQLLGAEYQRHNNQNNQPMPNTERTHFYLLAKIISPKAAAGTPAVVLLRLNPEK